MRTNGFAVFNGEDAPEAARRGMKRVVRFCRRVMVDVGDGFEEPQKAALAGRRRVALAYSMEGDGGFPLVHGFLEEGGRTARGEFAMVSQEDGRLVGGRDPLGTRALWAAGSGRDESLASDHRLLDGRLRLEPPGRPSLRGRREAPAFEDAARELASLLERSVRTRVGGLRRVAVSFSGGLDSSLLALVAAKHSEVVLCSAYAKGSLDERQTARAAELLGLRLEAGLIDEGSALADSGRGELPPGPATTMDSALWCIFSRTSELAHRSKAQVILLGQLADELFGGYRKYALKAKEEGALAAEKMMREDVKACGRRGFLRDEAACSAWAEARFPYADEGVASFASALPLGYKVRGDERKAVLRAAALELGLPQELALAPKKAAQFSSGAAKLFNHLGF